MERNVLPPVRSHLNPRSLIIGWNEVRMLFDWSSGQWLLFEQAGR